MTSYWLPACAFFGGLVLLLVGMGYLAEWFSIWRIGR